MVYVPWRTAACVECVFMLSVQSQAVLVWAKSVVHGQQGGLVEQGSNSRAVRCTYARYRVLRDAGARRALPGAERRGPGDADRQLRSVASARGPPHCFLMFRHGRFMVARRLGC